MDDPELYKPETSLTNEESSVTTEDAANNNNSDGTPVQIEQNTQRSTWPRYEWFWESLCSSRRKIQYKWNLRQNVESKDDASPLSNL